MADCVSHELTGSSSIHSVIHCTHFCVGQTLARLSTKQWGDMVPTSEAFPSADGQWCINRQLSQNESFLKTVLSTKFISFYKTLRPLWVIALGEIQLTFASQLLDSPSPPRSTNRSSIWWREKQNRRQGLSRGQPGGTGIKLWCLSRCLNKDQCVPRLCLLHWPWLTGNVQKLT